MWNYEKRLQYPINIKTPNAKLAQFIMSQYGGPDGEIGASMRYLSQRFTMPNRTSAAVLNDIGTEELAHLEMVSTMVHQLTRDLTMEEIENSGLGHIILTTQLACGHRQQGVFPLMPVNSRVKVIRLRIYLKTLQQNRKHAPLMTIFSV